MYELAYMHGISTDEHYPYDWQIAVMREMHWSWSDLLEAPYDMPEIILAELGARNKWARKKREWDEQMSK